MCGFKTSRGNAITKPSRKSKVSPPQRRKELPGYLPRPARSPKVRLCFLAKGAEAHKRTVPFKDSVVSRLSQMPIRYVAQTSGLIPLNLRCSSEKR